MGNGGKTRVIRKIAAEGLAAEPLGKDFLKRHSLGSPSSVRTALELLTDKELLYRQPEGYRVYDRFLELWLKRL